MQRGWGICVFPEGHVLRKRGRVSRKRHRQRQLKWVPSHGGDRGFHSTVTGGLRMVSRWKQLT